MTGALRTTARNPIAIALMGLLILVFLILGVGGAGRFPDLLAGAHGDAVVVAGSHTTSSQDFRKIFEQQKQRVEQQEKQDLPTDLLVKNGVHLQILNALADDQAESEWLKRIGVGPDPSLIGDEIKKLPFAFDHVTGKFNEQQYVQYLAQQGLTPRQAEAELTDELAQRHFEVALESGIRVPLSYAALNAAVALENRDISYFTIDAHVVPTPPAPTDAQLLAFMNEHAAQLKRPEMRVISLVRFSAKALEPMVKVDPAAVQKEFDFRKDSLSSPERRTIVALPVKTTTLGSQVAARLAAGEDPAAVAQSLGIEPVNYADAAQSAIPDRKVAIAAFALKQGQSSGPVQGDLGLAVLKVVKISPAVTPDFQSARAAIEADLRTKAAKDQAYQLSEKFDEAQKGGATLAAAAKAAGVPVLTVGPVTSDGADVDGKPNPDLTPQILKSAFGRAQGEDGDLEDAGSGESFAVHVDKVLAPALPPLDEKRDLLTKAYIHEQILKALKAKADALIAQVHKGATMDQVAAQVGAHVIRQPGMERMQAQQYKALGGEFLQGAFNSKAGDLFPAGAQTGLSVVRLDAIRPGDLTMMARGVQTIEGKLTQQYVQDLLASVKAGARKQIGVVINPTLATQALGIDPSTLTGSSGKSAPAAK